MFIFTKLNSFFETTRTLSLWDRLFRWKKYQHLSFDAYAEFKALNDKLMEESKRLTLFETKYEEMRSKLSASETKNVLFEENYKEKTKELSSILQELRLDKETRLQEKETEEKKLRQILQESWQRHEINVEQTIKALCQKHQITYVEKEKIPFTGKPDNTVSIAEEFIIFDAKSPQGEDLSNFATYLRVQAESAKKYAKQEMVKKDIFLVVPLNAMSALKETCFDFADYRVYVVTPDVLEPLLLNLKKIETYEFAQNLSPEDRESIVTLLGKMAHSLKRRIQVDHYFSKEFLSLLMSAENLPPDILEGAKKVERSVKLNPPQEKRAKEISLKNLHEENKQMQGEAHVKGINTDKGMEKMNEIPLYESPLKQND
ncbi:MAG: hypothetical protein KBD63_02985 [Bacteriovoracaceae bacterium]|nr:hypothetical protein [Bacteriovoracaceae bacterium]